ncbi:MAG: hypothetical protein A3K83_00705 [Omnitrophica WOR_2 bacterium RBG_13_44_8b]|nr:MAG: hypothetical protein A3K83_00705 [Omnitrophica WOR_2 bacterium RBG_13_44_8b]
MQEYSIKVPPESSGMRLDLFIMSFFENKKLGFSRNFVQKLIADEKVTLKDMTDVKPHYKVKTNDELKVTVEEKKSDTLKPENIPLDVVYEDNDLAIINKPSGLVVHPAPGNYEHTLVNALLYRFKNLSDINPERPGIVHRLDRETSGLIAIAKNNFSHQSLAKQFAKHSIKRKYVAIVKGRVELDENVIELPIERHAVKRKTMSVGYSSGSKYAKTFYRTLKRSRNFSLLELEPFTGRTHQLRVHLAFLDYPILGDSKYGKNDEFPRLALHAKSLGFIHPRSQEYVEFDSEMPEEFKKFIEKLLS